MKKFMLIVVFGVFLAACSSSQPTETPKAVLVQFDHQLPCSLMDEPNTIGEVTANYICDAPGAFLTEVDTSGDPWTAGYFTTDTQITEVMFGPEKVEVVPNPNAQ